jgi:hypothetical protein
MIAGAGTGGTVAFHWKFSSRPGWLASFALARATETRDGDNNKGAAIMRLTNCDFLLTGELQRFVWAKT